MAEKKIKIKNIEAIGKEKKFATVTIIDEETEYSFQIDTWQLLADIDSVLYKWKNEIIPAYKKVELMSLKERENIMKKLIGHEV